MTIPAAFDGRRLRRRAWTVPFKLAFAPLAVAAAVILSPVAVYWPWAFLSEPFNVAAYAIGSIGPIPIGIAAVLSLCGLLMGLRFSSSASKVLAQRLGVRELGPESPLTQRVHRIAAALNLPPPKVATMPNTVNAYAIGSSIKDSAVVLGLPLVHGLSSDELDAVIGHELGHIVSGDMANMQMAAGFQSMVDGMLDGTTRVGAEVGRSQSRNSAVGALVYAAGQLIRGTVFLVSELLVKRQSRKREYVADAFGALAATPEAMASALRKLQTLSPGPASVPKAYQCLMFWNDGGSVFSTHPAFDRRITALQDGQHVRAVLAKGTGTRGQLIKKAAYSIWLFVSRATILLARGAASLMARTAANGRLQQYREAALEFAGRNPLLTGLGGVLFGMAAGLTIL